MKRISFVFLILGLVVTFASCKKDPLTWDLVVTNNTTEKLELYEKADADVVYHHVGSIDSMTSVKERGFVIDVEYRFEARRADGTVVAIYSHTQSNDKHETKTWTID